MTEETRSIFYFAFLFRGSIKIKCSYNSCCVGILYINSQLRGNYCDGVILNKVKRGGESRVYV